MLGWMQGLQRESDHRSNTPHTIPSELSICFWSYFLFLQRTACQDLEFFIVSCDFLPSKPQILNSCHFRELLGSYFSFSFSFLPVRDLRMFSHFPPGFPLAKAIKKGLTLSLRGLLQRRLSLGLMVWLQDWRLGSIKKCSWKVISRVPGPRFLHSM